MGRPEDIEYVAFHYSIVKMGVEIYTLDLSSTGHLLDAGETR